MTKKKKKKKAHQCEYAIMVSTAAEGAHVRGAITNEDWVYLLAVANLLGYMLTQRDPEGTIRYFVEHGSIEVVRELSRSHENRKWCSQESYANRLLKTATAIVWDY